MGKKETRRAVALLFFACGLPFGLLTETLPVLLRSLDLSAIAIGRAALLQLAWTLRIAWAPAIDRTPSMSRWLRRSAWLLCLGLVALALASGRGATRLVLVALAATSLASATLEACGDATLVRLRTLGKLDQHMAGGLRTACFKAGLTLGAGGTMAVAGLTGWPWPLLAMVVAIAGAAQFFSRLGEALPPLPRMPASEFRAGMRRWAQQPETGWLFVYAVTYKLALASVGPMAKLAWMDKDVPVVQLGTIVAVVGLLGATTGAMVASVVSARWTLAHALWSGTVLEIGACLVAAIAMGAAPLGAAAWPWAAGCSLLEAFAQGLTTSALTLLLLRHTDPRFAATQYSLLGATFGMTRALGGLIGGALLTGWGPHTGFLLASPLAFVCLLPMRRLRGLLERSHGGVAQADP